VARRTTEASVGAAHGGGPHAAFWNVYQPGLLVSSAEPGTVEFFADVERHRYSAEPHIPDVVRFDRWAGRDVLEAGCGIATDGVRFARSGARYTGLDFSTTALELARRRFALEGRPGAFVHGSVTALPFSDASFDLVYSHGVIHHIADTQRAVDEFQRVLRPGGKALVMVYHRDSLNYFVTVMGVRRALAAMLVVPGAVRAFARVTRERPEVLGRHRALLRDHGIRYLADGALFLSNNTDGPGNPLSKVFSRADARTLFKAFADVRFDVRFLNLRLYPGGRSLESTRLGRRLERHVGWHLYVDATKR
jgi:SAM-dependent methyltransferase